MVCTRLNFKYGCFAFSRFRIQPIFLCLLLCSLLLLFQGQVATLSEPLASGLFQYYSLNVNLQRNIIYADTVGLMVLYPTHIEYAVAHFRQYTETFVIQ